MLILDGQLAKNIDDFSVLKIYLLRIDREWFIANMKRTVRRDTDAMCLCAKIKLLTPEP